MKLFNKNIYVTFFSTNYCLYIILFFLVFGDTLTKIYLNDFLNFSWVFKAIISMLLILQLFILNKRLFFSLTILFISVLIGIIFNYQNDFVPKSTLFFEYISGIMIFSFLVTNNCKKDLKEGLFYIFTFYLATIILAAFLDLDSLKTYGNSGRFGFMPLFSAQNEFSFIMIAMVGFFYKNYIVKKNILNLILSIISIISALFIGTKVVYIFILIFSLYLTFKHLNLKYFISLFFLCLLSGIFLKESLMEFINTHFKVIVDVYYNTGLLDAISSLRLSYLRERIPCQISSFKFFNYFFGGLNMNCRTEMSIIDIFLFFGVLGGPFYIFLYVKHIYNKLGLDSFGNLLIITTTLLSFVGGAFFENLSAQFYILSVLFIYYYNPHSSFQNKVEKL